MKHKVIKFFTDLQDGDHPYNVGEEFPREGVTVSEARIQELSTVANRQGVPLIQAVEEDPDNGDTAYGIPVVEGHFVEKSLSAMKKKDLSKLAQDLGLDISECKVTADFVALLSAVDVEADVTTKDDTEEQ